MPVYKFRVSFEDHEDIYRDIEIKPSQTFEDLHQIILQSIGFDNSQPASFFMSDDNWKRGQEITSAPRKVKIKGEEVDLPVMKNARLNEFIIDPHQKIYYMADPKGQWTFYVELIKIIADDAATAYPRIVKKSGDAPKQFGASTLGKASSDFDFFNESGIDVPEEGEDSLIEGDTGEEEDASDELGEEMDEMGMADEEHHDDL